MPLRGCTVCELYPSSQTSQHVVTHEAAGFSDIVRLVPFVLFAENFPAKTDCKRLIGRFRGGMNRHTSLKTRRQTVLSTIPSLTDPGGHIAETFSDEVVCRATVVVMFRLKIWRVSRPQGRSYDPGDTPSPWFSLESTRTSAGAFCMRPCTRV